MRDMQPNAGALVADKRALRDGDDAPVLAGDGPRLGKDSGEPALRAQPSRTTRPSTRTDTSDRQAHYGAKAQPRTPSHIAAV